MGREYSRRAALRAAALGATTVLAAPAILRGRFRVLAHSTREYTKRCVDLVTGSLVIDMVAPLTINGETQERWGQDGAGDGA